MKISRVVGTYLVLWRQLMVHQAIMRVRIDVYRDPSIASLDLNSDVLSIGNAVDKEAVVF
jgi:hypothetical protein